MASELITAGMLAELLGVHYVTLSRMKTAGEIPAPTATIRARDRWLRREIDEWIAAGCPCRDEWETRKAIAAAGKPNGDRGNRTPTRG